MLVLYKSMRNPFYEASHVPLKTVLGPRKNKNMPVTKIIMKIMVPMEKMASSNLFFLSDPTIRIADTVETREAHKQKHDGG